MRLDSSLLFHDSNIISIQLYNNKFKLLTIFDITHNAKIIERWKWKYTPLVMSKSAYYLYNAVFPQMPIAPSKTLIIL